MRDNHSILLTIDVEDWFQVENFKPWIPFSSWSTRKLRVEKNTHRLLDLFDSIKANCPNNQQSEIYPVKSSSYLTGDRSPINTTFFILGWIAERLPNLVREIHTRGHEVASHGYDHILCPECSLEDLKTDLINSKKLLEDIISDRVYGYRAPSFAINNDILKTIQECGYLYDSSYNSFALHDRYGQMDFSQNEKNGIAIQISKKQNPKSKILYELPISNLKLGRHVFPFGGGGYFRLIPFPIFKRGVKFILTKENDCLFYLHPWEIDHEQPKVSEASRFYKFRHYTNLNKTHAKLLRLIESFHQHQFITCYQYISELEN